MSEEQVAAVGEAFNLTLPKSGPLYSASLIERRRVAAEEASRRAHELELEAQQRASELEEARRRAEAAAAEAQGAARERANAEAATIETGGQPLPRDE